MKGRYLYRRRGGICISEGVVYELGFIEVLKLCIPDDTADKENLLLLETKAREVPLDIFEIDFRIPEIELFLLSRACVSQVCSSPLVIDDKANYWQLFVLFRRLATAHQVARVAFLFVILVRFCVNFSHSFFRLAPSAAGGADADVPADQLRVSCPD